jgi:dihydrodipicolinate synthase/N-acetylneuraminate lyase
VAVAVHTTQFAIREPRIGLLRPVLELAAQTIDREAGRPVVKVAGVCGGTAQALEEAALAADLGYDILLVQLGAFGDADDAVLLEHCRRLAEVRPLFGFYLQPAVGGRRLGYGFWRQFAEIENAVAVKIAPFNRYATLDVVRGVADSGRADRVALYTGNDDHIALDLLTPFQVKQQTLRIVGGLLGHWAVWTLRAVELLQQIHAVGLGERPIPSQLLVYANEITDANAAFFDPVHEFAGSIAGIHEVLRRQGLLAGRWCLDPAEDLSSGQLEEIDRVYACYPHLNDDAFVSAHLEDWLK